MTQSKACVIITYTPDSQDFVSLNGERMLETALENSSGRNGLMGSGMALGRITAVYPQQRFCEVKTFFGEAGLVDIHIPRCQWLSVDANPEGDESTSIPRVNSTGLVFFVAGEPFIFGFFKATTKKGGATTGKEQTKLNEGDKVVSTVGGNRFVVKSNGVIELHSKETLKTIYFPKTGLLSSICEAYQLKSDGGNISWKTINKLNETLHKAEYRRDLARTSIVYEEKGRVSATVMRRTSIGPGIPGIEGVQVPVFQQTIDITGEVKTDIGLLGAGISFKATPLGGFNMANLLSSFEMTELGDCKLKTPIATISASATGDIKAENAVASASIAATGEIGLKNTLSKATISATGDITVEAPAASIVISAAGEVKITSAQKTTIDAKLGVDIKSLGPINVEALGPVMVKGLTIGLDGTGGGGAINNVLCFPLTVSQFTGAPLTPFSTSVKVSP